MVTAAREWPEVDRDIFEREIVPLGEPAVLRGLVAEWPAVRAGGSPEAVAAYLRRFDLDRPCDTLIGSPAIKGRFFYSDDLQGLNFQRRAPTLETVVERLLRAADEEAPPAIAAQGLPIPEMLPGFGAENRLALLDESVVPRMWIGNRVVTACHYDTMRNIACVVAGRRQFTLFPPEQVRNLYIGPFEFTPAGAPISMVDFDAPDLARFPDFPKAMAAALVADLEPGDALYLPYMWWHHVRSRDSFSLLVNYWWDDAEPGIASPTDAMLLGLLAIRDLPEEHRAAWRALFDQFVFRSHGDPMAHVPREAQGGLGHLTPDQARAMRDGLIRTLSK